MPDPTKSKGAVDQFRYRGATTGQILRAVNDRGDMEPVDYANAGHYEPLIDNTDPDTPSLVWLASGDLLMVWVEG